MTSRVDGVKRMATAVCLAFWALCPCLVAQDTELQFISGLRDRGYYDTALEYLDQLEQSTTLAPESREILDLERGITLQQRGAASRVPEDRDLYFGQSEEALKRFLAAYPSHARRTAVRPGSNIHLAG